MKSVFQTLLKALLIISVLAVFITACTSSKQKTKPGQWPEGRPLPRSQETEGARKSLPHKKIPFDYETFYKFSISVDGDGTSRSDMVSFTAVKGYFELAAGGKSPDILIDGSEFSGVKKIAGQLVDDIFNVSGGRSRISGDGKTAAKTAVIIGTLGKSALIDRLAASGKIKASELNGKWEKFIIQTVANPLPGIDQALVISGSDKRGTIYGIYHLSESIGVSPWYWWADVPIQQNSSIYIKPGQFSLGEPGVKYRGIFINDEAPALSGWVGEKFRRMDSRFYEKVFELILRLKGNFLWPAMWGKSMFRDDPKSAPLADEYGIVIGTTHHEPMMRSQSEWAGKGKWRYDTNEEGLKKFWREGIRRMDGHESIVSIGMRGDGDKAMSQETAVPLLEKIIMDQRQIIEEETGKPASETPQIWTLYKEVQDYWDQGMRVPDDVTVMLSDDNWGNIRKLPKPGEDERSGGFGIYYHFDYVGGPRSYRWINTNQIERVWEQMHLAWQYNARRLWIVNVGDLKPMEFPIQFFLDYAWAPESMRAGDIGAWAENWAEEQFGPKHAADIAEIMNMYTKYNSRRKPELLNPSTYSVMHYGEADRVLNDYRALARKAKDIMKELPSEYASAYTQLVTYPVEASANLCEMYIAAAKNRLYKELGFTEANKMAETVKRDFDIDAELVGNYHSLEEGRWNHMMDQFKIGYTGWNEPKYEIAPQTEKVVPAAKASMGVITGKDGQTAPRDGYKLSLPPLDPVSRPDSFIELFNLGTPAYEYAAGAAADWIVIDKPQGIVDTYARLNVSIDWNKIPAGKQTAKITVKGAGKKVSVTVTADRDAWKQFSGKKGFLEQDGYVSINADSFSGTGSSSDYDIIVIPNLGRDGSALSIAPKSGAGKELDKDSPHAEYPVLLQSNGKLDISFLLSPTLDFFNRGGLRFAVSIDNGKPKIVNMHEGFNWPSAVSDNIRTVHAEFENISSGAHTLKVWGIDPGIVLQKILIDTGGLKDSYLGPPESHAIR